MDLKNYMEEAVFNLMDEVLSEIKVCNCPRCRIDIAAIALNSLPPKYIVSSKGELYSKTETLKQQFDVDIISALTKAVVIVKRNPRHNEE